MTFANHSFDCSTLWSISHGSHPFATINIWIYLASRWHPSTKQN